MTDEKRLEELTQLVKLLMQENHEALAEARKNLNKLAELLAQVAGKMDSLQQRIHELENPRKGRMN